MPDPVFDIAGKIVVITGGCGLIGRTLVQAFRERGAKLVIVDLEDQDPTGFAKEVGGEIMGEVCDVSQVSQVQGLRSNVMDRFGRIDVLINNHHYLAKQAWDSRAENYPEEAWKGIIDVNLTGTFLMCREFGRVMLQQGKGNIINVASTYGVVSSNPALYQDNTLASPVAYSASKGGVIMLTKYLASYWGERGVRVNAITPHGVWNSQEKSFEKRFNQMTPFKVSTVFPRS